MSSRGDNKPAAIAHANNFLVYWKYDKPAVRRAFSLVAISRRRRYNTLRSSYLLVCRIL